MNKSFGSEWRIIMEIFEKFSETLKQKSKVAADKAKEVAGLAQLKIQINTQEDLIRKNYQEIGKRYFDLYRDMPEDPFIKECDDIKAAKREIERLQEQIELLKK